MCDNLKYTSEGRPTIPGDLSDPTDFNASRALILRYATLTPSRFSRRENVGEIVVELLKKTSLDRIFSWRLESKPVSCKQHINAAALEV